MKYIKTLIGAFAVLALFATVASAAPSTNLVATTTDTQSPWTFAVSGQGNSKLDNNSSKVQNSTIGAGLELGYGTKIVLPAEVGVRQTFNYSDASGATLNYSTKAFSDWRVIRVGNLEADAGANIGVSYGSQPLDVTASPEVVGRIYLKKDVDVFARAEYPFDITRSESQNNLIYTIGLRVRF